MLNVTEVVVDLLMIVAHGYLTATYQAPPPRHRTSTERDNGDIGFSDHKHMSAHEMSNNFKMDDDQKRKSTKDETVICSGADKTILLDVLAGRKSSGTVKGEIKIGGYT
ncbi:hypothetical protein Tco_0863168 [Tanacetum coccineum]